MTWKILLVACFFAVTAYGSEYCKNYKLVQFRRPDILPVFEIPSPCNAVYGGQNNICEGSLNPIYQTNSVNDYITSYVEPKTVGSKCFCSKPLPTRYLNDASRFFKRKYCNEPVNGAKSMTPPQFINYNQFKGCQDYSACNAYGMPSAGFRQPSQVLPLTLPISCIC